MSEHPASVLATQIDTKILQPLIAEFDVNDVDSRVEVLVRAIERMATLIAQLHVMAEPIRLPQYSGKPVERELAD